MSSQNCVRHKEWLAWDPRPTSKFKCMFEACVINSHQLTPTNFSQPLLLALAALHTTRHSTARDANGCRPSRHFTFSFFTCLRCTSAFTALVQRLRCCVRLSVSPCESRHIPHVLEAHNIHRTMWMLDSCYSTSFQHTLGQTAVCMKCTLPNTIAETNHAFVQSKTDAPLTPA